MSDKAGVERSDEGTGNHAPDRSLWRRVLFGVQADRAADRMTRRPKPQTQKDRLGTVVVPLFVAGLAFGGVALGSYITSADNDRAIRAERDRIIEQFRLDQRKDRYDEIRQQLTRLENASDFSKTAVLAGVNLPFATSGITTDLSSLLSTSGAREPEEEAVDKIKLQVAALTAQTAASKAAQEALGGVGTGLRSGGAVRSTWQDAYTGLDQAISNAEIASSEEVINIARALRDKYRADYLQSILENIDVIIDNYPPDRKPDKKKFADALVGVPAETAPPSYDAALLVKSTDELTAMYVRAAKDDLELDDR
ncbi:hypothetical protein NLB33_27085 [Mycolicibacterium smegmatis]|uniref:hypothetical protein n=1 Tax=Mycolicibacterium smegmatis TaxID=1772 RepID=UPI0020A308AE|nr:hypothetical protein [Mycolicibacterium smegmatis]MCP2626513.1 hypothetical protein [Mycolicibacterium smegmatis]